MAQKGVVFSTGLTIKECSDVFRQAAERARGTVARLSEMAATIAGNGEVKGFFTPTFDSPFASVDGVPDFSVGIVILKWSGGAQGNGTPVHMYVDERHDHREVQLVSKHGFTGAARSARVTTVFFDQFKAADPRLEITDGNI